MKCLFRAEYDEGKYGCIYYNEPNSLAIRDACPYKDKDINKCKLFLEKFGKDISKPILWGIKENDMT